MSGLGRVAIPTDIDRGRLAELMSECQQAAGQSVLDHGKSVWEHFTTLIGHLSGRGEIPDWWRIPDWARQPGILARLPSMAILEEYATWHDCGKPYTVEIDENGRRHFPGHAAASEQVWLAVGGDPLAARLMGMDMDAHLLKADGLAEFASRPEATALLLMALAEVHSNADLFGGQQSDSFKIKAKHLDKRGGQVMRLISA